MLEFKMPSLGADMDEGKLIEWKVKPGDRVTKGQVVAVVDTSKAAIDVEIWFDGTVRELLTAPGETIPVGAVMATLTAPGEEAGAATPARRRISPAARKRAERQRLAEQSIHDDPLVQQMIQQFGASIRPDSIEPLTP